MDHVVIKKSLLVVMVKVFKIWYDHVLVKSVKWDCFGTEGKNVKMLPNSFILNQFYN